MFLRALTLLIDVSEDVAAVVIAEIGAVAVVEL